jgi:hypothetical protein
MTSDMATAAFGSKDFENIEVVVIVAFLLFEIQLKSFF